MREFARQLDVAGFICKAPSRGLRLTAPGGFAPPKAAVFNCRPYRGPLPLGRGHRPWVEVAQNARQLDVAGFACQAPSRGLRPTAPGGFAPRRPQFPTAGRVGAQRPRPRPSFVGGNCTERPATGSCGLHLPSPRTGAATNRPGGFASEGRSFQPPAVPGPTPLAAAIVRGWKSHETPGNWKLRASFAKPPGGGCTQPPPAVSPHRRPQFPTAGRVGPTAPGRGHRPWVEAARNARQLDVAGLICKAPWRGLRPTAPGGFASRRPQFPTAGRLRATLLPAPHPSPPSNFAGFACKAP